MRRAGLAVGASALLLALGAFAQQPAEKAQGAPPAPPAKDAAAPAAAPAAVSQEAAPQSDRLDLSSSLESWYRITQGDDASHIGYMHEILARAPQGTSWRWTYDLTSEVELSLTDERGQKKPTPETYSQQISQARLDDSLVPISLELSEVRGEQQLQGKVASDESGRRIEVVLSSAERPTFPVAAEEEVHYSLSLMFVSLRQTGQLARPGQRKANLLSLKQDGTAPLAEVVFEIREAVKREYQGKKDVFVTPVSFLKPPPAAARDLELTEAYIDRYGRIVEAATRGGVRRLLVKTEKEAVGGRPMIGSSRRDPWRKDLALASKGATRAAEGQDERPPVPENPDQFAKSVESLQKQVEELRKANDEKRSVEAEQLYQKILDTLEVLTKAHQDQRMGPAQAGQLVQIRQDAERIYGGLERLMKQLRLVYVRCLQLFDQDDCPGMERSIEELRKALNRRELKGQEQLGEVVKWIGQLEPLVARCKTRLELARKKLVVTGTTTAEEWEPVPLDLRVSVFGHQVGAIHPVRFVRPIRLAVINGQTYRVGDVVEGEGVRVEKIWTYGVQVSLRDETRDVGLQQ